jgi:hypothetical protein
MRITPRFFSVVLAFALVSGVAAAAPKATASAALMAQYPESLSGDFVVYRDYSWKEPTWIGFLRYDDSTWGAFVKTPSSGADVRILFRAERSGGTLVLTGQNIISKISQGDVPAVNYLMQLLPDLSAWRYQAEREGAVVPAATIVPGAAGSPVGKRSELLPPCVSLARDRAEFGGAVTLFFAPEVPVFNLAAMRGSGSDKTSGAMLALERTGRIQSGGDDAFFAFVPRGEPKASAALAVPASRKTEKRAVDGIELALDGQWTMVADNTFFLGNSAVVIVDTLDLALMQIPRDNLALSLVRLFSLSSGASWASPDALTVSGTAKRFRIENSIYDAESGTVNRDIKLCVPSADGKHCAVATLSVNESAYRANKAYFDSIF